MIPIHQLIIHLLLLGELIKPNFVVVRIEKDAQPVGGERATAGALRSRSLEMAKFNALSNS